MGPANGGSNGISGRRSRAAGARRAAGKPVTGGGAACPGRRRRHRRDGKTITADLISLEYVFDYCRVSELSSQVTKGFSPLSGMTLVPVLPALRAVLPAGGLRPGTVTGVDGSLTLALALAAGLGERWWAVVGLPEAHVPAAAAAMAGASTAGVDGGPGTPRVVMVDDPGRRWADVVAALSDGCALVVMRPPEPPAPHVVRRLTALARRNGCALVTTAPWAGADLWLRVEESHWSGLGDGTGHLRGRRALVAASGRGAAGPGLRAWLWLPGPDGAVAPAEPVVAPAHLTAVAG